MHLKFTVSFLLVLFFAISLNAQVKTNFNSIVKIDTEGKYKKRYKQTIVQRPSPDLKQALINDSIESLNLGAKPFVFAEPIASNINIVEQTNWIYEGDFAFGRFNLKVPGAKSLSINFENFFLPEGTEMFVYNEDGSMITGPITSAENNERKIWGSSIYKGDVLHIEIKLPLNLKHELTLQLSNIAYGFKNIFIEKIAGFGQSGSCNINVLCPQGADWANERNTVVYIAMENGSALCSGAMLNNTCVSNIPYVLTANHCYNTFPAVQDVSKWRIHFQAWSAACTPSQNSDGILFNGATLKANWAPSDFALVQLNQTPPSNSGIHYAGWSRSTSAATSGVGIHHPSGDVMKISNYITPLIREDNPSRCGINPVGELHWVVQWNEGVTEGGSSGSPLFDQNHRVVGQLSGGPSSCAQPANCRMDMYGRFDNSWTGGGTNSTRLSNWLDPSNSGAMTTNTTNVSQLSIPNTGSTVRISGDFNFCNSGTYTIANAPVGVNVSWAVSPSSAASLSVSGNQVTVTSNWAAGDVTLSATLIGSCYSSPVQLQKQITIGVPNHLLDVLEYQGVFPVTEFYSYTSYSFGARSTEPYYYYPYYLETPYQFAGTSSYDWKIIKYDAYGGSVLYNLGTYGYGVNPDFYFEEAGEYDIVLDIINSSCNYHSRYFTRRITVQNHLGAFSVSPNPSSDNIRIAPNTNKGSASKIKPSDIRAVEIIDKMGGIKYKQQFNKGLTTVTLSVNQLPNDIYTLRIFDGQKWHALRIVVQH